MRENNSTVHSSFWLEVKEFSTWNIDALSRKCDCPGPPPQFYLPPPPWPHCVSDFTCMDNMIPEIGICKTFSVIRDEYHHSLSLTPVSVVPIVAAVIFLLIGTILVLIRRKKVQQLHPRKSSTISNCESAIASSIIYEDMTDIHLRELTSLGSSCQLPFSEMTRTNQNMVSPVLISSSSPVPKFHRSKGLLSPVYKEFSSAYNGKQVTGSEGILSKFNREDECTEDEQDEISFDGGVEYYRNATQESRNTLLLGTDVADFLKKLDFSVANERYKFLESCEKNLNSASYREKEARIFRGVLFDSSDCSTEKRLRRSGKKRERKDKFLINCNSYSSRTVEGFLLKKTSPVLSKCT